MIQSYESHPSFFIDLYNFVKIIKQRQQNHLNLLEYIWKISQPQQDGSFLLDEELKQHQTFKESLNDKQLMLQQMYDRLINKWEDNSHIDLQGMKNHQLKYLIFLSQPLKEQNVTNNFINTNIRFTDKAMLSIKIILTCTYSKSQIENSSTLLVQIIQNIENGRSKTSRQIIETRYKFIRTKIQNQIIRIQRLKQQQEKDRLQKQKQKQQERLKIQQKLKIAQQKQKMITKNKKRISKFTNNVMSKLYSPLMFSKIQFASDMLFTDELEQKERLLNDIRQRNKLAKSEINNFIEYSKNMNEKVKILSIKQNKVKLVHSSCISSPKNIKQKIRLGSSKLDSTVKSHASNRQIDFQSKQSAAGLPPIKQRTQKHLIQTKITQSIEQSTTKSVNVVVEKPLNFIKSPDYEKIESKQQIYSSKPLYVFDNIKFPTQRKQFIMKQGLRHIRMIERVKMDMNKTKNALNFKNIHKVMPSQSKQRFETSDSGISFINYGINYNFSEDYYNETTFTKKPLA